MAGQCLRLFMSAQQHHCDDNYDSTDIEVDKPHTAQVIHTQTQSHKLP